MDIFSLFTLCGGLAFFLYGMSVMSSGLEKVAGGRLEQLLKKMTDNPLKSLLLGAGITIAIQSSAASVAILQALSLSGGITFGIALPIIMGQNIGTCVTALLGILAEDPRPSYQADPDRVYGLSFAGLEIKFTVHGGQVEVTAVQPPDFT